MYDTGAHSRKSLTHQALPSGGKRALEAWAHEAHSPATGRTVGKQETGSALPNWRLCLGHGLVGSWPARSRKLSAGHLTALLLPDAVLFTDVAAPLLLAMSRQVTRSR